MDTDNPCLKIHVNLPHKVQSLTNQAAFSNAQISGNEECVMRRAWSKMKARSKSPVSAVDLRAAVAQAWRRCEVNKASIAPDPPQGFMGGFCFEVTGLDLAPGTQQSTLCAEIRIICEYYAAT